MKKAKNYTPSQLAEALNLSEDFKQKIRENELNDIIKKNRDIVMGSGEEILDIKEADFESDDFEIIE